MAAAQRGDSIAYVVLLHEIAHWVRALSSDQSGKEISEDIVRASLLRVHWARFTYDPRRPFGPWISAVVGYSLRRPVIRRSTGFWRHRIGRLTAVRRGQAF
jgi:RNA polymerase sigma-70 factor (ECF subfamily)